MIWKSLLVSLFLILFLSACSNQAENNSQQTTEPQEDEVSGMADNQLTDEQQSLFAVSSCITEEEATMRMLPPVAFCINHPDSFQLMNDEVKSVNYLDLYYTNEQGHIIEYALGYYTNPYGGEGVQELINDIAANLKVQQPNCEIVFKGVKPFANRECHQLHAHIVIKDEAYGKPGDYFMMFVLLDPEGGVGTGVSMMIQTNAQTGLNSYEAVNNSVIGDIARSFRFMYDS